MKLVIASIAPLILSATTCLFVSCGGGNSTTQVTSIGPTAILNGGTLATATSHWVGTNCVVLVELTTDGGAITSITDTSGNTYGNQTKWAALGSNGAEMNGSMIFIDQLTSINGSTKSGAFSAGIDVDNNGFHYSLGTCQFALQSGQIPVG